MIQKIVDFALENRFLVLAVAVLLLAWGMISVPEKARETSWIAVTPPSASTRTTASS